MPGTLFIVATPIGNLADSSDRARRILNDVALIACEDTRTSTRLLQHLDISKPLIAYHEHNEQQLTPQLADRIANGESIALICDAGTPTLSDPGFRLVRECRRRNLPVSPIPGPCAFIAALSASGLPTNAFRYVGFLAPKSAARIRFLETIRTAPETTVLYESCHRIDKFAKEIAQILGPERIVCFARELTKLHETFLIGPISEQLPLLQGNNLRGEFVVIIAPHDFHL